MISRRSFLKCAVTFTCGSQLAAGSRLFASAASGASREKVLRLYNIHTGERVHARYCLEGNYDQEEVNRIHYLLRCHYSNEVQPIDIGVIDLLCAIKDRMGSDEEIKVISGYRSPRYNEYLRGLGRHVAAGSLHLAGLAIDFVIPGIGTKQVSKVAMGFQAGGVGLYPEFVHIDVGRVRHW